MATLTGLSSSLKGHGPGTGSHVYAGGQGQGADDNFCFRQQAADLGMDLFDEPLSVIRVLEQDQWVRTCFNLQFVHGKLQLIRPAAGQTDFFHAIGHGADNRFHVQQVTEKTLCFGNSAPGCQIFQLIYKNIFPAVLAALFSIVDDLGCIFGVARKASGEKGDEAETS